MLGRLGWRCGLARWRRRARPGRTPPRRTRPTAEHRDQADSAELVPVRIGLEPLGGPAQHRDVARLIEHVGGEHRSQGAPASSGPGSSKAHTATCSVTQLWAAVTATRPSPQPSSSTRRPVQVDVAGHPLAVQLLSHVSSFRASGHPLHADPTPEAVHQSERNTSSPTDVGTRPRELLKGEHGSLCHVRERAPSRAS